MTPYHVPILLPECMDGLQVEPDRLYLDGTLGGGGHTEEILRRGGRVVGIDRDDDAIAYTGERLAGQALQILKGNFCDVKALLAAAQIEEPLAGVLLDLGVSSHQLDDASRGFSYRFDAPLDMRMDQTAGFSAADVVNEWSEEQLQKILFEYGEERYARRIVRHIVENRPVRTTGELVQLISEAMPAKSKAEKHPAKRTFQAIRIAVNDELSRLSQGILDLFDLLAPKGRLAIITFHSLEDRIVKNTFANLCKGCTCPKEFPVCVCGGKPKAVQITRKPLVAGEKEQKENPRSTSAKLRVIEKTEE